MSISDNEEKDEPDYGIFYFDANCKCSQKDCFVCNQKPMPPEFSEIVDKYFFDLV